MKITLVAPDHSIMLELDIPSYRGPDPRAVICGDQVFVKREQQSELFDQVPFINLDRAARIQRQAGNGS